MLCDEMQRTIHQTGLLIISISNVLSKLPFTFYFHFQTTRFVRFPTQAKRRKGISALIENQLTMVPIGHGHFLGTGGLGVTSGPTPYGSVVTNRNGVGNSATLPTIMANTGKQRGQERLSTHNYGQYRWTWDSLCDMYKLCIEGLPNIFPYILL